MPDIDPNKFQDDHPASGGIDPAKFSDNPDNAGSVYDKRSFFRKAASAVKDAAPTIAKVGIPIAAGLAMGPEAGLGARVAMQGAAGAVASGASSALQGKSPDLSDIITTAAWNAGGEGVIGGAVAGARKLMGAGTAAHVAGDFAPTGERAVTKTPKQVDAAVRRFKFLQASGVSDEQIAKITNTPELAAQLDTKIAQVQDVKQSFQGVVNTGKSYWSGVINNAIGPFKGVKLGDPSAITTTIEQFGADKGQMSAGLNAFLTKQGAALGGGTGVPADVEKTLQANYRDPELLAKARENYLKQNPVTASPGMTIDQAQKMKDQLWDFYMRGRGANGFDQKAIVNVSQAIDKQIESSARSAGATSEQLAQYHEGRQGWNTFHRAVDQLDPRGESFGTKAADALYGEMKGNPDEALEIAKTVSAAAKLNPKAKQQFATGFLEHFMRESSNDGGPIGQMQAFAKFRRAFARSGADNSGQRFLEETFGKGSPMANETAFGKIIGKVGDPEQTARDVNGVQKLFKSMSNPAFMLRTGAIVLAFHAMSGQSGGVYKAMTSGEGMLAIAMYMASTKGAAALLGAGGPISTRFADYRLNPTPNNLSKFLNVFITVPGAVGGAVATQPDQPSQ